MDCCRWTSMARHFRYRDGRNRWEYSIHHSHRDRNIPSRTLYVGISGTLWVFITLATLAIGLLGWVVVRRGLAPLHSIKTSGSRNYCQSPAYPLAGGGPPRSPDRYLERHAVAARNRSGACRIFSSDPGARIAGLRSANISSPKTQVTLSRARSADEYRYPRVQRQRSSSLIPNDC